MRLAACLATLAATIGVVPMFAVRAPTDVCVIDDARATELSGLVAVGTGFVAINDSQPNADNIRVIYLDASCHVTGTLRYPSSARDPEDVAIAPDGTLWSADTGDNINAETRRQTVALWKIPAGGGAPVIHRLTYPDGPHDAEALLFAGDGTPIIVTKELSGHAGLYRPTAALQPQTTAGVPLKKVGEFVPQSTGENNLLGAVGEVVVTGAATSPDRTRVALRTYTAAYEWDVKDGDVVKAITTTTPRLTALPDEPQGESIAYSPDGAAFLTVSDETGPTTMRRIVPSTAPLPAAPASGSPTVAEAPKGITAIPVWYSIAAATGGLALAAVGFFGMRRSRREQARNALLANDSAELPV